MSTTDNRMTTKLNFEYLPVFITDSIGERDVR